MLAKRFFYVCAGILCLALAYHLGAGRAQGQSGSTLLAMADYPRLQYSAVAVDESGGIYFGHLKQWSRVGTTPSAPASIWSRDSDGGVVIALKNGDLYHLGEPNLPVGDWRLTYDSNVFGGAPTSATKESWGAVKSRYRPDAPAQDK